MQGRNSLDICDFLLNELVYPGLNDQVYPELFVTKMYVQLELASELMMTKLFAEMASAACTSCGAAPYVAQYRVLPAASLAEQATYVVCAA